MLVRTFRGSGLGASPECEDDAARAVGQERTFEEVSFVPPVGWAERTIVSYVAPPAFGGETKASLVIVREKLPDTQTLLDFANKHLVDLGISARHARFVEQDGMLVYHLYEMRGCLGELERTVSFFETGGAEGFVVHVTTTCAKGDARGHAMLEEVLASLRRSPPPRGRMHSDVAPRR